MRKNIYIPQPEVQKVYIEKEKTILPKNIREVKPLDIVQLGTKEIIIEKRERILPTNIKEIRAPRYVKELPQKEIVIEKRERILPTNIKEIKAPRYVKELPKIVKQPVEPVQQVAPKTIPELKQQVKPNLNSGMTPQEIDMLLAPAYDKMFSLDDYKKMRNMLVEKRHEKYESRQSERLKFQQLKDLYEA